MKKLLYILPILLLSFTACDSVDFGDTNVDDDAVTSADAQGLMAGAMNRYFTLSGRDYMSKPTLYIQYQSQNVYTDEQLYNEAPSPWSGYYVRTLSNLQNVIELNQADPVDELTITYGAPENQIGVSELMSVLIWKRVTDVWGPVPYKDALGEDDLTPEYIDQETIYKDLIERAKAARDQLNTAAAGPTGDVVYGGDVAKWKKFANSMILSLSMQLTKKYPGASGYAATEFNAALNNSAGVIEDIADEAWYEHANAPGATNPYSAFRGADYNLSQPFTDALKGQADGSTITYSNSTYDARLDVFADDPTISGRPYGKSAYGPDEYPGPYSSMSQNIVGPAAPLPYMTAAYTYLNRAEAAALGWTNEVAADMFAMGVTKSYESLDAHYVGDGSLAAEAADYVAARAADLGTVGTLQVIREEKWVGLFPMGFDAWAEWRRTGVPGLIPASDAVNSGEIPRRYLYPSDEAGVNTEAYNGGVNKLSPGNDSNTSQFWWDMN